MNNYAMVKSKTIFYYLHKFTRFLKHLVIYGIVFNILFILSHTSLRIYQGSNAYVDYLDKNAIEIMFILLLVSLFYIGCLVENHIRISFYFLTMPMIFLISTYYLSFAFPVKHYSTIPALFVILFVLTIFELAFKKHSYKVRKLQVMNEDFNVAY